MALLYNPQQRPLMGPIIEGANNPLDQADDTRPLIGAPAPVDQKALAPIAAPSTARPLGVPMNTPLVRSAAPPDPSMDANRAELARITKPPLPASDPNAHTKADTGESGIGQIHNKPARVALRIGDALLSTFLPGLAMGLPGTQLHHQALVKEREGLLNEDEKRATESATQAKLGAETANQNAQAVEHSRAPKDQLEWSEGTQPEVDPAHPELGPQAVWYNKADPTQKHFGGAPVAAKPTEPKEPAQNVHVLPDGSVVAVNHDAKTGKSTAEVVYKGDPKIPTEVKQLQINGKPHQVLINSQSGETIKDLGETGEKPPVVNVSAGNNALDHEIGQYGRPWQTMSTGVSSQLDKILDAEKMVAGGAIQQALGIPKVLTALVSGQGSGVRITQAELNSIAKARGLGGDIEGWFRKLSGKGNLTPEQQQQLGGVLQDVRERILQKKTIADSALDEMQSGRTREDVIAADKKARKALDDFERGGGGRQAAPAVGTVLNGYRFKGGDLNKPESWEEVKK